MNPNTLLSCKEQNSCGNKRSRRAAASATRGWHDDSLPGAGFLYNSVPLDSVGSTAIPRQRLGSRVSLSRRVSYQERPHLPVLWWLDLLALARKMASSECDTAWVFLQMNISKEANAR